MVEVCNSLLWAYLERSGAPLARLSCPCTDEHLATIAEAIDDWETLAPHLRVLKPQQTAIKRDFPGQTVKQKQELLWQWKTQGGIDATYLNLCAVFWRLEKTNLVDTVCDCVRAAPPQLTFPATPTLLPLPARDDTYVQPPYYGPLKVCKVTRYPRQARIEEVKREVYKLEGQFQDLVVKMRCVVEAKDPTTFRNDFVYGLLSIDSAKKPLHRKFLERKIEAGAESIESILRALSYYWNFINSDLLEHIVAQILDDADLQQRLESYLTAKHSFCEMTTVCEFEAAKTQLPVMLPQFEIPPDQSVIVLQVVREWADYTIAQALAVWQSIADKIQVYKILGFFAGGSSSNSVNLVWAVAPDVISLVAAALTDQHVRERNAIKAVCIDGKLLPVVVQEQKSGQETQQLHLTRTGQQGWETAMGEEEKPEEKHKELTSHDLSRLTVLLDDAGTKWHELGLQLGVRKGRLNAIEEDHRRSHRRLMEMLNSWVNGTKSPTVQKLVDALRSEDVNEEKLADKVIEMFC